jgi:hypothetical protein
MLKIIGTLLILSGGLSFCFGESRRRQREMQGFADWLRALEQMESEIRCKNADLPDIMGRLTGAAAPVIAQVLHRAGAACPLQDAWEETVGAVQPPELAHTLRGLRFTGDRQSVLGNLQFGQEQLKAQLAEEKSRRQDKNRLLWATTFSGVGLLVILLL